MNTKRRNTGTRAATRHTRRDPASSPGISFDAGIIAAGLAHEIRNPLSIIKSSAQFCLAEYSSDPLLRRNLEMILRNVETSNKVLRELIHFSRPAPLQLDRGSLNNTVSKSCELARSRCIKEKVRMKVKLAKRIPCVMLDGPQLEGALVNLMFNALDAMEGGGALHVSTAQDGKKAVTVTLSDTGCGIPDEVADRMFDPFVTSKKQGVGLGLAVVKRVVDGHRGSIEFNTRRGRGTVFILSFPAV